MGKDKRMVLPGAVREMNGGEKEEVKMPMGEKRNNQPRREVQEEKEQNLQSEEFEEKKYSNTASASSSPASSTPTASANPATSIRSHRGFCKRFGWSFWYLCRASAFWLLVFLVKLLFDYYVLWPSVAGVTVDSLCHPTSTSQFHDMGVDNMSEETLAFTLHVACPVFVCLLWFITALMSLSTTYVSYILTLSLLGALTPHLFLSTTRWQRSWHTCLLILFYVSIVLSLFFGIWMIAITSMGLMVIILSIGMDWKDKGLYSLEEGRQMLEKRGETEENRWKGIQHEEEKKRGKERKRKKEEVDSDSDSDSESEVEASRDKQIGSQRAKPAATASFIRKSSPTPSNLCAPSPSRSNPVLNGLRSLLQSLYQRPLTLEQTHCTWHSILQHFYATDSISESQMEQLLKMEDWDSFVSTEVKGKNGKEEILESTVERLVYWFQSLLNVQRRNPHKLPSLLEVKSLSIVIPLYNERIFYTAKELRQEGENGSNHSNSNRNPIGGLTPLEFLVEKHKQEWNYLAERIQFPVPSSSSTVAPTYEDGFSDRSRALFDWFLQAGNEEVRSGMVGKQFDEFEGAVIDWCSYRSQTLARTIQGLATIYDAFMLLAQYDLHHIDNANYTGSATSSSNSSSSVSSANTSILNRSLFNSATLRHLISSKVQILVAAQTCGIRSNQSHREALQRLCGSFPCVEIVYDMDMKRDIEEKVKMASKLYRLTVTNAIATSGEAGRLRQQINEGIGAELEEEEQKNEMEINEADSFACHLSTILHSLQWMQEKLVKTADARNVVIKLLEQKAAQRQHARPAHMNSSQRSIEIDATTAATGQTDRRIQILPSPRPITTTSTSPPPSFTSSSVPSSFSSSTSAVSSSFSDIEVESLAQLDVQMIQINQYCMQQLKQIQQMVHTGENYHQQQQEEEKIFEPVQQPISTSLVASSLSRSLSSLLSHLSQFSNSNSLLSSPSHAPSVSIQPVRSNLSVATSSTSTGPNCSFYQPSVSIAASTVPLVPSSSVLSQFTSTIRTTPSPSPRDQVGATVEVEQNGIGIAGQIGVSALEKENSEVVVVIVELMESVYKLLCELNEQQRQLYLYFIQSPPVFPSLLTAHINQCDSKEAEIEASSKPDTKATVEANLTLSLDQELQSALSLSLTACVAVSAFPFYSIHSHFICGSERILHLLGRQSPLLLGEFPSQSTSSSASASSSSSFPSPPPIALPKTSGKSENQLHSLPFARGEILQTLDMNQSFTYEEALKLPLFLSTLQYDPSTDFPRFVLSGCLEHIYTYSISCVARFLALQDTSFVSIVQRVLSYTNSRLHYGHPDIFDAYWCRFHIGVSKASSEVNLSEDLFFGLDMIERGEECEYVEWIRYGKGREVHLQATAVFEDKLARGAGQALKSPDLYRLPKSLDSLSSLSLLFSSIGHYVFTLLFDFSITSFLYLTLLMSLSHISSNRIGLLGSSLAVPWLFHLGYAFSIPLLAQLIFEYGWWKGSKVWIKNLILGSVYYLFQLRTKAVGVQTGLRGGNGQYSATGRGFGFESLSLLQLYTSFAFSHYHHSLHLLLLLFSYIFFYSTEPFFYTTLLKCYAILIAILSWMIAPVLFNPVVRVGMREETLEERGKQGKRQWREVWRWVKKEFPCQQGKEAGNGIEGDNGKMESWQQWWWHHRLSQLHNRALRVLLAPPSRRFSHHPYILSFLSFLSTLLSCLPWLFISYSLLLSARSILIPLFIYIVLILFVHALTARKLHSFLLTALILLYYSYLEFFHLLSSPSSSSSFASSHSTTSSSLLSFSVFSQVLTSLFALAVVAVVLTEMGLSIVDGWLTAKISKEMKQRRNQGKEGKEKKEKQAENQMSEAGSSSSTTSSSSSAAYDFSSLLDHRPKAYSLVCNHRLFICWQLIFRYLCPLLISSFQCFVRIGCSWICELHTYVMYSISIAQVNRNRHRQTMQRQRENK